MIKQALGHVTRPTGTQSTSTKHIDEAPPVDVYLCLANGIKIKASSAPSVAIHVSAAAATVPRGGSHPRPVRTPGCCCGGVLVGGGLRNRRRLLLR